MRNLIPITLLAFAVSLAPSPASGYGLYELCFGRASKGCSCGCEVGCACEPGCACVCATGCGCSPHCTCGPACHCTPESRCSPDCRCGAHGGVAPAGGGCGCDVVCEPSCGCGACCSVNGRQFAGKTWKGCGECCGPPNCRCVEPDGSCRPNCCAQCIDYRRAKGCCSGCCGKTGCGGACCGTAGGCGGCCEPACGCGAACGCGCHDGGGTLWFKQCGFCQPCWEVLDVIHSISKRCCCGGCGGGCGCSSELYWSEWHNDPPRCCDPCDRHGNWIGPTAGYRAPYAHPYAPGSAVYAAGKTKAPSQVAQRPGHAEPQQRVARQPQAAPAAKRVW